MQHCPTCGYQSPDGTRFCRQCGEQLAPGSDPLESTTRTYGRREAVAPAAGSMSLPPSIGDAVAGDTARYQRPAPVVQPGYVPPGRFPAAADTSSFKKKRRLLKWGGLLFALLASGGIGAAINEASNDDRIYLSQDDRTRLERIRIEDQVKRSLTGAVTEFQERAREQVSQRLEAIERAREDAERAAERGDVTALGEKPLDLTPFEYPGASAGQYSRIPGRELLTQRTKDDVDTVTRFYQEKLGKPFIQVSERNPRQILFQSPGSPSVTVLVRETRDRSRQPEIIILRSPFRFPVAQTDQQATGVEAIEKVATELKKATK